MNHKQYNKIVLDYSNRVCRFIDKMIINREAAKDLTQDAYFKLWENKDKVNPEKARSWLFTTAYRLTLEYIEKQRRFPKAEFFPDKGAEMINPDLQQILNKAFSLLSEQQNPSLTQDFDEEYSLIPAFGYHPTLPQNRERRKGRRLWT